MDRAIKILSVVLVVLVATTLFLCYSVYASVRNAGFIAVDIDHKDFMGPHAYIPVPAVIVNALADLATLNSVHCHDCDLAEWKPAVRAALGEFDRFPNIVLMEVINGDERVEIRKSGSEMIVHVDAPDADVRISIPQRTVKKLANAITSTSNVHTRFDHDCTEWEDVTLDL